MDYYFGSFVVVINQILERKIVMAGKDLNLKELRHSHEVLSNLIFNLKIHIFNVIYLLLCGVTYLFKPNNLVLITFFRNYQIRLNML